MKFEKGTKPTDWTPAPEDIISRVATAETSIEQNSKAIKLSATKTDLNNAINGVNSTLSEYNTRIEENATAISLKATKTEVTTAADKALTDSKAYTDAQIKVSSDSIISTIGTTFATTKALDALSENVNSYIESSTSMIQDINGWQYTWNRILRTDEADIENHQDYITFQNGDIILGESSNNLKVKISNDAIQFKGDSDVDITPDSDATAWITGKQFNIDRGEIHTSLKIGNLQFTPRSNGNFSIAIAT